MLSGELYRLDNTPDARFSPVSTYPIHFHYKEYENVKEFTSSSEDIPVLFREFLSLVQSLLEDIKALSSPSYIKSIEKARAAKKRYSLKEVKKIHRRSIYKKR